MSTDIGAREWFDGACAHIDVRELPAPQPLIAILQRVHAMAPHQQLVVHHDRDPVLLYPELAELGWEAVPLEAPPGEVRLLVRAVA